MSFFPASLEKLVEKFASLPGVGRKSAQRLAFHVLSLSDAEAQDFASAITEAKSKVHACRICQNLTDTEVCGICSSPNRDPSTVCVVADPKDVAAIERAREYKGTYHVLHGVISPLNEGGVEEIIMATNPDTEGETTAKYISRLLRPFGVKVTRLAYGIPMGASLEFADDATLMRALEGRREI